jgi:hypothetical protein
VGITYTDAIALVPPPPTGSAATYSRWLDQMKVKSARGNNANRVPKDPDVLLLESYRFLARQAKRLPPRHQTRKEFAHRLIGLVMTQFDLEAQKFMPEEIPPGFRSPRSQYGISVT